MAVTVWSDLHQNVEVGAQGNIRTVINVEAVKTSIDNILRTRRGERLWLPEFGSGLGDFLFESLNDKTLDSAAKEIQKTISIWEPRVSLRGVDFVSDPDNNSLEIAVSFIINGYDQVFQYKGKFSTN